MGRPVRNSPQRADAIVAQVSRVLLVADASWVVNEVKSSLTLGDWAIEEVSDPRQVTDIAASERTDAVIVDMQVGSMGGMAVVRDIRQSFFDEDRPRTVLLLDRSADEFIAKRAGADAYVVKPIVATELREALGPATGETYATPSPRARKSAPAASVEEE